MRSRLSTSQLFRASRAYGCMFGALIWWAPSVAPCAEAAPQVGAESPVTSPTAGNGGTLDTASAPDGAPAMGEARGSAVAMDERPSANALSDASAETAASGASAPNDAAPAAPLAGSAKRSNGPEPSFEGSAGNGVTADFGDAFSVNLKSRVQIRYQLDVPAMNAAGERTAQQTVNIGTARIWLGGHVLTPRLNYLIQLAVAGRDFREGATSPIYDAFLDWKLHRDLSLKVGQYFVPFDRLRTVREWALQMADRPRPVAELTLDRDVGITAYSDRFLGDDSIVAWKLGAFGGGGTNLSTGKKAGALAVGRLELRPFGALDDDIEGDLERRRTPRLALGVAGAANWNTNRLRSTTGATFAGVVDYLHADLDLVFKWRGFALQGEVLWRKASSDRVTGASADAPEEATQSGKGWVIQSSYILPIPLEFVARLSELHADAGTDPAFVQMVALTGREAAAGVNYYLNGHKFKIQADYIARMPPGFVFDQAVHAAHLQLDITL